MLRSCTGSQARPISGAPLGDQLPQGVVRPHVRAIETTPGHRLYIVVVPEGARAARHVLDLCSTKNGRWLVDLSAEL